MQMARREKARPKGEEGQEREGCIEGQREHRPFCRLLRIQKTSGVPISPHFSSPLAFSPLHTRLTPFSLTFQLVSLPTPRCVGILHLHPCAARACDAKDCSIDRYSMRRVHILVTAGTFVITTTAMSRLSIYRVVMHGIS